MTFPDKPKRVTVGAWTFTIDSGPKATLELAHDGDFGSTDVGALTIKVRSDVAEAIWWETLLHEVIHAAWAQTPLAATFTQDQEEQAVRGLAPLLFTLLVRWHDGQVG